MAQLNWKNWILQPVEWDEKEWIPRQACIEVFVKEGLFPFLRENGIRLTCNFHTLGESIARCMYYGRIRHIPSNQDYTDEEYDFYYFCLNDEKWEGFWRDWALWPDLLEYHPHIREGIRYCAWTFIDIESSKLFDSIHSSSDSDDEESGFHDRQRGRASDPYIADAANGYFS